MIDLNITALLHAYRTNSLHPWQVMEEILQCAKNHAEDGIWITPPQEAWLREWVRRLEQRNMQELPLYGIPFAVKDNIDVAGLPTTCACPASSFTPQQSATVVQKLINAGAIPVGKTNMDQFATGLNGSRSPYGICHNAFNKEYISGGSSSGSAVAVARGMASFALGTDTAGSGRVPAAFNNLIGLKPSCGRLSTHGVFPACRSLDVVSIFALSATDAERILSISEGEDKNDSYSRKFTYGQTIEQTIGQAAGQTNATEFRFAIPRHDQLEFFGNDEAGVLFDLAVERLIAIGGHKHEIDFSPWMNAARLLYEGPWIAERYLAIQELITTHPEEIEPNVYQIISAGRDHTAMQVFAAQYRLQAFKQQSMNAFSEFDVLLLPTAGRAYSIAEMQANPLTLNTHLGYYTNFMNLLDMAAVAAPAGFQSNGLPFGITLCAPSGTDRALLSLTHRYLMAANAPIGNQTGVPQHDQFPALPAATVKVAVVGAHLTGMPLNHQLQDRHARFVAAVRTAPVYRLYALPDGLRPGLVRTDDGASIAVEIWELPITHYGSFVASVTAPLGIGSILLESGETVQGFICESYGIVDWRDITEYGGWRGFLQRSQHVVD